MSSVPLPDGYRVASLRADHPRDRFQCGQPEVDDWLRTKAWQNQRKHLSATKVLVDSTGIIAGYFTLATGQVDFGDLPSEIVRKLPKRALPVAIIAWLGIATSRQGQKLGDRLLAQALRDCHAAGATFSFIAVLVDCVDERARSFYERWPFRPFPGHPLRMFLSTDTLAAMLDQ